MTCPCKFEPDVPFDCVRNTIDIVKAGKYGNGEIASAVMHISCFSGSVGAIFCANCNDETNTIKSMPNLFNGVSPLPANASCDEICEALEKAVGQAKQTEISVQDIKNWDWASLFNIITMLWQLIQQFRNESKT